MTRGATSRHVGLHHDSDRKPVCRRSRSAILMNDDPIGSPLPASRKGMDLHPPMRRRGASRSEWEVNGELDHQYTGKKREHSKALMQANTICRQQSIISVYIAFGFWLTEMHIVKLVVFWKGTGSAQNLHCLSSGTRQRPWSLGLLAEHRVWQDNTGLCMHCI